MQYLSLFSDQFSCSLRNDHLTLVRLIGSSTYLFNQPGFFRAVQWLNQVDGSLSFPLHSWTTGAGLHGNDAGWQLSPLLQTSVFLSSKNWWDISFRASSFSVLMMWHEKELYVHRRCCVFWTVELTSTDQMSLEPHLCTLLAGNKTPHDTRVVRTDLV